MDAAATFDGVVGIVDSATEPVASAAAILDYLDAVAGTVICTPIRRVDAAADVAAVRSQLTSLLSAEPPPAAISAFYFGLFDAEDEHGADTIGYYIAGVEEFDRDDGDSLCDPAWWPDGRYLSSGLLESVRSTEIFQRKQGADESAKLLGYAGQIGVAALVTKFASQGLLGGASRIVGFDSGDFVELDVAERA